MAIITRQKKRIGDLLVDAGVITQEKLEAALELQKERKQKLGILLIEEGYVTEQQIAYTLHKQMGYDIVELGKYNISTDILKLVPDVALLKRANAIPFEFDPFDSQYLRVAMSDPLDIFAIDDIQMVTGMQVSPVIATQSDIMSAIDKYYGSAENQAVADMFNQGRELEEEEEEAVDESIENAPIVILVRRIIEQGVHKRASDIHIEPMETKIRVRYRVDGVMQEAGAYQVSMLAAIITRIKIVGGMDISEKRKPQDGRITAMVDRNEYDIRVSILPTVYGEKVVMRLTSKQTLSRDKKLLGFSDDELKRFDRMFANPNGIILVTGPTGSGKSTTLYTALSELNTEFVNIVTVEDPVEANIPGINQVQVNVKANMTFANALRSILRQDPDIIMIGEIRDEETANIAVTASITGHLVVSTLHTNSSSASITRLVDMGLDSYLIADSVVGVIAQRLARRLCSCKVPHEATEEEKRIIRVPQDQNITIYGPGGCNQCNFTGYRGRIGVYEMMTVTRKIKNIIAAKGNTEDIEKVAIEEGMSTLHSSAARLVREGVTSIDELRRIVFSNDEEDL
ncbi:MAG: ATPase, T2SS/T4P/T4SS family [Lachnospiraceae bacterium]|nr:Flp pilus assembly complex ATPase component TadA [Lachnoclostridium sp.]MDY2599723.1 ATPase, T2SS/T4P/T4SS family [Lachnospiraceae bacterium]